MNTNEYMTRRLVLRRCPAEDAVAEYANRNGWPCIGRTEEATDEDGGEGVVCEGLWQAAPSVVMHYVEDAMTGNCYVLASGDSPGDTDSFLERLAADLDTWTFDELLYAVEQESDPEELGRAVNRLTLGAPLEHNRRVLDLLDAVLRHPNALTRTLAIWSMLNMPWPQYRTLLRRVARTDSDAEVRATAEDMLATYDAAGIGEP